MISPGLTIIWCYLGISYLIPCAINSLYDLQAVSSYQIYPVHGWTFLFVIFFAISFVPFDRPFQMPAKPHINFRLLPPQKWQLTFAILFVTIGLLGNLSGLNQFRYSEKSAFAGGISLVYLVALLPFFIKFDFFCRVFFPQQLSEPEKKQDRWIRLLMATAALLTINGTASALFAGSYFFFALYPKRFVALFCGSPQFRLPRLRVFLWGGSLLAIIVAVGWMLGESVKRGGTQSVFSQVSNESFFTWAMIWLGERTSSTYYSTLMAIHNHLFVFDLEPLRNLFIPIETFLYRLNICLGKPLIVLKPEVSQISRLNYELLSFTANAREGTSPGLIGSFLLCFPFPLNIAALFGYSTVLISCYNRLVKVMPMTPNVFGLLLITWLGLFLFESPFDLLLIIDEGVILLGLVTWVYYKALKEQKKARGYRKKFRRPRRRLPSSVHSV